MYILGDVKDFFWNSPSLPPWEHACKPPVTLWNPYGCNVSEHLWVTTVLCGATHYVVARKKTWINYELAVDNDPHIVLAL